MTSSPGETLAAIAGEVELDARAGAGLAVDGDVAAGLFDEAVDHAEAKAGAFADFLGREERLEHPAERLLVHARARVAHRDHHVLAGDHFGVGGGIALVEVNVRRLDGQEAAVRHGVAGVDAEIQDCALELVRIDIHRPEARREDTLQLDGLAQASGGRGPSCCG